MSAWLSWLLLPVFVIHLAAFSLLWLRRRQGYYLALVATFALLSVSVSLQLWGKAPEFAGRGLATWLRFAAWAAAAVSVSWTLARLRRRFQAGRQNCS